MKRVSSIGLALMSLAALSVAASAEPGANGPSNNNGSFQWTGRRPYENWQFQRELYRKLTKKHHKPQPIPIDPGRGDGGLPVEPQTPQGPPGFIWVNGHWERVRAPEGTQNSPVVVRDHRTTPPRGEWHAQPDVSSSQGGVTVTPSPRWPARRPSPYGGVQVRDHRTGTTGNAGPWYGAGGSQVRDHRR